MKVVFLLLAGVALLRALRRSRPMPSDERPQLYEFGWGDGENEGMPTDMVVRQAG
jgi:hypothetical protein